MQHWMAFLGSHFRKMRKKYVNDKLIIVFDIDGTILDMRFIILFILRNFDKRNKSNYFSKLRISDIDFHETQLKLLLDRMGLNTEDQESILSNFENLFLPMLTIKKANKPFRGVFEIIRWFQMQPNTYVGLNTGRPESLRFRPLSSLNFLGKESGVRFSNELLFMNKKGLSANIPLIKREGIEYFRNLGFRVFAFVDNEPENLKAVAEIDSKSEILLLHAESLFKSPKSVMTGNFVSGIDYCVEKLRSAV
ncbi:MAG: hypothetical protein N2513_09795 [Deltaproteobacteria bacterium]|nr:hypothetical protein [Deltaproteobacteria bacterium]